MDKKWEEMTPEEKRSVRFKKWYDAEDVVFDSPKAEKDYRERVNRLSAALLLKEPDRVPCSLPAGNFPAYYSGGNLKKVMYDYEALKNSWLKFVSDFEMDTYMGPNLVYSGKAMEIADYLLYRWPGHGLGDNVTSYQFVEGEYMKPDEYEELINDASDFTLRKMIPRTIGSLKAFEKLPRLSAITGMPIRFLTSMIDPEVRAAFQSLIDAGTEMEIWQKAVTECNRRGASAGYPSMRGGMGVAPFDTLADSLRGTQGAIMDMYRQPEKMHEAMDRISRRTIQNCIEMADASGGIMVSFPLHKGDDTFMSDKQFEEFYWPSLKKVILALIQEGIMVMCFAEGRYERRLDAIAELPKGWTEWQFDQTSMKNAKNIIGDVACIAGNVPASLMVTGTPADVKKACRQLIEDCASGGGYILTGGCSATEATAENMHAMMEAAREYGVY